MRNLIKSVFLTTALLASPFATAQDYEPEIDNVETLGKIIYQLDQAAWHTTDALLADAGADIPGLAGWISVQDGRDIVTKFIAERDGVLSSVWEAISRKSKVRKSVLLKAPKPLSEAELALWRAKKAPMKTEFEFCKQFLPMNSLVFPIPGDAQGRLYVYYFSASKTPGEVVLGKHYRFTVSADGNEISETRSFTNSCFSIGPPPAGKNLAGLSATHLNAPYPEEHHVFANLSAGVDLYVGTPENNLVWKVSDGRIVRLK